MGLYRKSSLISNLNNVRFLHYHLWDIQPLFLFNKTNFNITKWLILRQNDDKPTAILTHCRQTSQILERMMGMEKKELSVLTTLQWRVWEGCYYNLRLQAILETPSLEHRSTHVRSSTKFLNQTDPLSPICFSWVKHLECTLFRKHCVD